MRGKFAQPFQRLRMYGGAPVLVAQLFAAVEAFCVKDLSEDVDKHSGVCYTERIKKK